MAKGVLRVVPVASVFGFLAHADQAHTGAGIAGGFWSGVLHPIPGWDHVSAMAAAGLCWLA